MVDNREVERGVQVKCESLHSLQGDAAVDNRYRTGKLYIFV
jgi:hypothetical protein